MTRQRLPRLCKGDPQKLGHAIGLTNNRRERVESFKLGAYVTRSLYARLINPIRLQVRGVYNITRYPEDRNDQYGMIRRYLSRTPEPWEDAP